MLELKRGITGISLGFGLFLIKSLLGFTKKYEGFVSLDTFFSFKKGITEMKLARFEKNVSGCSLMPFFS